MLGIGHPDWNRPVMLSPCEPRYEMVGGGANDDRLAEEFLNRANGDRVGHSGAGQSIDGEADQSSLVVENDALLSSPGGIDASSWRIQGRPFKNRTAAILDGHTRMNIASGSSKRDFTGAFH